MFKLLVILDCMLLYTLVSCESGHNKYTREQNAGKPSTVKLLEKPFRMAKLNLLWSKAVIRLSEQKLRMLYGQLQTHDEQELTWKHLRAEGKDKDGLKEAELRKKLLSIMRNYNLLDQVEGFEDTSKFVPYKPLNEASDKHINKSLFKDKKLNKLWEKAETAGFTNEELGALKDEFDHHQDKIDQYYALLHDIKKDHQDDAGEMDDNLDKFNNIELREENKPSQDYLQKVNHLREKHQDIRQNYDNLSDLTAKGPNSGKFIEPRVRELWKIARESKFTPSELESLRVELVHYENRLLKLRHIQAESALSQDHHKKKMEIVGGKTNGMILAQENIKKLTRGIEKIHLHLETKIMQKHIEL